MTNYRIGAWNSRVTDVCDRCGKPMILSVGSAFNTDILCFDCKDIEEAHPLYETVRKAKAEAAKRGEVSFRIHLPPELRKKK